MRLGALLATLGAAGVSPPHGVRGWAAALVSATAYPRSQAPVRQLDAPTCAYEGHDGGRDAPHPTPAARTAVFPHRMCVVQAVHRQEAQGRLSVWRHDV